MSKIHTLYAFIVDSDDGEAIPTFRGMGRTVTPMIGSDLVRVGDLRQVILRDPSLKGKRVTLAHFTCRQDIEVLEP